LNLPHFYQQKRDFFRAGLAHTRFKLLPCEGTYFQSVDFSAISPMREAEFCKWLTAEIGVAAIPTSAFYGNAFDQHIVRFCFAKKTETLSLALQQLKTL
jgi:methionine aminotransferase